MKPLTILTPFALITLASPALADRAPTIKERTAIEAKLISAGFIRWENIELEDDGSVWEVDDAVAAADGREYDLLLNPITLEILRRDPN